MYETQPSEYDAKRLSPEALAAQEAYLKEKEARETRQATGKEAEAELAADVEAGKTADKAAEDFIQGFLDNEQYRVFLKLIDNKEIEEAKKIKDELVMQMEELTKASPKYKKPLEGIKEKLIAEPFAKIKAAAEAGAE
ncbi:hypothetical protein KKE33_01645 [Patescibacteria group bacterium]|nr:hypothetical protein [Patescibacteria group bacterium]